MLTLSPIPSISPLTTVPPPSSSAMANNLSVVGCFPSIDAEPKLVSAERPEASGMRRCVSDNDLTRLSNTNKLNAIGEASPRSLCSFVRNCTFPMLGADGAFLMPGHGSCASGLMAYRARVAENKTAGLMGVEEALAKVPVEALPDERVQSAQPTVGILFSEWFQLGARSMVEVIQLVRDHGCRPLLILPMADALVAEDQAQRLSAIEQLTQQLDGLIALGGKDIDPSIYGQRNQASLHVNLTRDRFDSSILLNALLGRQMYLLAICRSHQLVNATLGGELIQDMRSAGYAEISRNQTDYAVPSDQPFQLKDAQGGVIFSHDVDVLPESDAGQIIGQTPLLTNSFHHQVVSSPGKNLRVCGTLHDAKLNKRTIEMTESWQLTSLQFHPERLLALEVFEKLAGTACRRAHLFFQQKLAPVADAAAAGQWMENFQGQKPFLPADKTWISRNFARIRI